MKEVYPNIFLIEEKGLFRPSHNIYLIAGNDGLIFDAGYGNKSALKQFFNQIDEIEDYYKEQKIEMKTTRILCSHAHSDHFSGLKEIRDKLGLNIILTEKIASIIRDKGSFNKSYQTDGYEDNLQFRRNCFRKLMNFLRNLGERAVYKRLFGLSYLSKPDEIIDDNTELVVNGEVWRIFPSPGHSPDHISLYNEEKGILLSGDNVLYMRSTWLGTPESNLIEYLDTIQEYQNLPNLKRILPAHGEIIENPKETLTAILERMKEREEQVLETIYSHSEEGISPKGIIKNIYSKKKPIVRIIALGWVVLTLKMLEDKNLIRRKTTKRKTLFFPIKSDKK
ncbi:MAG: MBL fold metallo-hydrolase [Promethearchaeota archaeon]|jgi:glyoxylase-like metal-dependent hydrolase (beta-lactamase superfamily II)